MFLLINLKNKNVNIKQTNEGESYREEAKFKQKMSYPYISAFEGEEKQCKCIFHCISN
jgi:hypothetical protein